MNSIKKGDKFIAGTVEANYDYYLSTDEEIKEKEQNNDKDKFIAGTIEAGYDNHLSVQEEVDEKEKEIEEDYEIER